MFQTTNQLWLIMDLPDPASRAAAGLRGSDSKRHAQPDRRTILEKNLWNWGYIWVIYELYMGYIWVIYIYIFIYLNPKPFLDYDPFPISNDLPVWKKASQTAAIMGPKNRGFSRHLGSLGPKIHRWNRSENRLSQQRWTLVKLSKELMVTLW